MKAYFIIILGFFISLPSLGQEVKTFNVMFYNVENLFDTIDNPQTLDEDFTPNGKLEYTTTRYHEKLKNLAMVIDSSFTGKSPSILGLCEVENKNVVEELKNRISIDNSLAVFHMESSDGRGIDNVILYDSTLFGLKSFGLEQIELGADERPTRGVLWAVFIERSLNQKLIVLVNHWPSRYGGAEESEWKRVKAAQTSIDLMDSLHSNNPDAGLILMGDLNDHPDNASVKLLKNCNQGEGPCMTNVHEKYLGTDKGSHAYRGEWGVLDQILVNQVILSGELGWSISKDAGDFVKKPWMLYFSEKDEDYFPSRSYGGINYFGGFSDHLPAIMTLQLR
jgi:predicted extracellular nuclease